MTAPSAFSRYSGAAESMHFSGGGYYEHHLENYLGGRCGRVEQSSRVRAIGRSASAPNRRF